MTRTPVIAIFDVGKTNKKLFLFDEQYNIVLEESVQLKEGMDEDGMPCEDVLALTKWVKQSLAKVFAMQEMELKAINFSAYGASFVHMDREGRHLTHLYNYLKPYPEKLKNEFYSKYGGEKSFSLCTASPVLGSLNSGQQLYRLKEEQPDIFKKVNYSLHLPQYLSYLVTKRAYSDITSIGCHTGLWDYSQNRYHEWVYREGIIGKLAGIFPSDQVIKSQWDKHFLGAGVGLHDSSAALIPYMLNFNEPFVLLSTGTWCISLNPFNQSSLTAEELTQDCLCYMSYKGKPIKASRLFAGYEHEQQTKLLAAHFHTATDHYRKVEFDSEIAWKLTGGNYKESKVGLMQQSDFGERDLNTYETYQTAYHQLIIDLLAQQLTSTKLVLKNSDSRKIFVDGGFSSNPVYMNLLAAAFPRLEVYATSIPQATALGAALSVHRSWNKKPLPSSLVELKHYEKIAVSL